MPSTTSPLVSIIIPTYNHRRYICEAVDSALAQTYPHCEVIVLDDGSTDGTGELLQQRYGDRIRYIFQENRGLPAARNTGTRQANGDYVNYCDADDKLLPEKITRCMAAFEQQPDAAVVYTNYRHMADDGTLLDPPTTTMQPSDNIFCELLTGTQGNFIMEAAPLIRRSAISDVGCFDETLSNAHDWDMWLRLATRYPFVYLPEPLALYRHVPNAMHTNAIGMTESRLRIFQKARDYPGRAACIDDAAYDRVLAGRYHMLAIVYWRAGRRAEAREMLRTAIRIEPDRNRARRLYRWLSYVMPADAALQLNQSLLRLLSRFR